MRKLTRWDEQFSTKETNELLQKLALYHARQINDAATRERYLANIVGGDLSVLCDFDLAYGEASLNSVIHGRQIAAFYSKRSDIDVGVDRERAAALKFKESEDLCRETNAIFDSRSRGGFLFPPRVESRLFAAQRKISAILGDVPSLSDLKVRFGPGATTQVLKRNASARRKLGQALACSEEMLPRIREYLEELQGWIFTEESPESLMVPVEIHTGDLVFVPKNCKTYRSVVVEPSLNTMFQAGIGAMMTKRLKRFGIDLKDQTRNQRLALEGSLTGDLATLDLSSASDTIARELVFDLLPYDWALLLSGCRTGTVSFKGLTLRLQKFSSMGNGFTFPLESLIFYALASACVEECDQHLVSVYGDDIIVPTYAYADLTELLIAVGFIPNLEKSFATGPFRESCGVDYLSGINVRPLYIKGPLTGSDIFRLHNHYVRLHEEEPAQLVLSVIEETLRKWGPDGYGDGHLLGDGERRPLGRSKGWCGYTFETYTHRSRKDFTVSPGDRVYPSYTTYVAATEDEESRAPLTYLRSRRWVEEMRDWCRRTRESATQSMFSFYRKGELGCSVPGKKGYDLIKIYTLT